MAYTTRRIGVVLFQLGGPDTLEAIEPFLFNLFCDPDIIDFPFARIGRKAAGQADLDHPRQKGTASLLLHRRRSPIRRFTEQQAHGAGSSNWKHGLDARCFVAMRYWHPFTAEAIDATSRRRIVTKWYCSRCIHNIPAPPPAAA